MDKLARKDKDVVARIIDHRIKQDDLRQMLTALSEDDRDEFVVKVADTLRKTTALLEVSKQVSDTLSLDVLLPRTVTLISEFLDADRCTLFLNDQASSELFSRVAEGDLTHEIRFPNHLGIAGSVFKSGESAIIEDAYADDRFNQEVDRKTGYRTRNILCAPIKTGRGEIIGVAQVLNKNQGDFSPDDLDLLQVLTSQAASAFVNAQLHEDIERARRDESELLEITTAISQELQLEPLLQKIMETVTANLNADRSTLFMYDKKTDELWSHVAQGMETKEIRFPAHLGIAGSVFKSGETINIPDAYADDRFNQEVDKKTGYHTHTILCMPVINKQSKTIGVVQVLNKQGGPFRTKDELRLRAFTSQATIAIENAQLFEEVVSMKNYNESILESMSNGVITITADNEIATANRAALSLFRCVDQPEKLLGKSTESFFFGQNAWIAVTLDSVRSSGKTSVALDVELWLNQEEPSAASVNLSVLPLLDSKEQHIGCLLMLEDITKEKRLRSTMARYMTKEVADKLLEDGEAVLGGQTQKATILFTDIRSFTSISEVLGATETVRLLNDYFSIMVDIILDHNGILDKYIGDAMMAVFGAPFATSEDADNALQGAIEMVVALRRFNQTRVSAGEDPVHMGVGINTDEVLSGNIGSIKRMDYTVIGDGVNLASRLESANKLYGTKILISENTAQALRKDYRLREVDKIRVKGKNEPVSVFAVMDCHDEQSFPRMNEVLARYQHGLEHYHNRNWSMAQTLFAEALSLNPNDSVSGLYLKRCQHFHTTPPADDWDGIWTMTSK